MLRLAIVCLGLFLATVAPARAGAIQLGLADDYTLLATGSVFGGSMVLGSAVDISGNIGARDSILIGTGSTIDGDAHGGSVQFDPSTTVTGSVETRSAAYWAQVDQDLRTAALQAAALSGTQHGHISSNTTLTGSGLSVFHLDGLSLNKGQTLTLDGTAGSEFIINVSNSFIMNGGARIEILGDLDPANVIFNMVDQAMIQMNNAIAVGTFLGAGSFMQLGDGNILEASRFLGGTLQGNLQRVRPANGTVVPEPGALALVLGGLAAVYTVRRRKQQV